MNRREFLQAVAAAAAAGLPVDAPAALDLAAGAAVLRRYRALRQREPAALHRLPRAASAHPISRAERQPGRRRRAWPAAASRRRGAAPAFRHRARDARRARVHLPRLHARGSGVRPDGRLRASRDARREAEGIAPRCAAARRRRHVAGLGDGALDAGPGHDRRAEAPGRRRDDRPLGVHARRRAREGGRRGRLQREDRLRRAEREDRGLRRPGVSVVTSSATINGVPVAIVGQAFPYTPIANPRYFVADWTFGIQDDHLQKIVDEARDQGRAGRRAAVAQRDGRRPEARDARAPGSMRSWAGTRTTACRSRRSSPTRGGKTLVTNAGSNGKFLAVLDLDVKDGKAARLALPAAAGVQQPVAARSGDGRADPQASRAVRRRSSARSSPSPKASSIAAAISTAPSTS